MIADVARQLANDPFAEWRINVINDHGRLVGVATTRRRPGDPDHHPATGRRTVTRSCV